MNDRRGEPSRRSGSKVAIILRELVGGVVSGKLQLWSAVAIGMKSLRECPSLNLIGSGFAL